MTAEKAALLRRTRGRRCQPRRTTMETATLASETDEELGRLAEADDGFVDGDGSASV